MHSDDAEETQITEIERDKEMNATMDYSGSILEGAIRFCKAKVYQLEIETENAVSQDYTEFLETVLEQHTTNHFVLKCIKVSAYKARRIKRICNLIAFSNTPKLISTQTHSSAYV